jgi:hypothetical protein
MTFICLNIELRTQPLIILIVIAGTDKERPGCSKILFLGAIFFILVRFANCVYEYSHFDVQKFCKNRSIIKIQ